MSTRIFLIALFTAVLASEASADGTPQWQASSPLQQVHVLELYTSQGCSSCPPADQWLLDVANTYPGFQTVIPLAFHVTYWDYLGWRDDFGQKVFDQRQRMLARRANTGVYTPGMFLNGDEWRQWRRGQPLPVADEVGRLSFSGDHDGQTRFEFTPLQKLQDKLLLHTAFLTSGARTKVNRGENRGRTLQEGYIVRTHRVFELGCDESCSFDASLTPPGDADALVAWVTTRSGDHVQAAGAFF